MSPHHRGIPKHDLQLNALEPLQQLQEIPPDPTLNPAVPAPINRVPVTVGQWQIPPRCTRAQNVQNALQRLAVPHRRRTPRTTVFGWQQPVDLLKVLVRQVIQTIHSRCLYQLITTNSLAHKSYFVL